MVKPLRLPSGVAVVAPAGRGKDAGAQVKIQVRENLWPAAFPQPCREGVEERRAHHDDRVSLLNVIVDRVQIAKRTRSCAEMRDAPPQMWGIPQPLCWALSNVNDFRRVGFRCE
jgi:hypothetical protein